MSLKSQCQLIDNNQNRLCFLLKSLYISKDKTIIVEPKKLKRSFQNEKIQ